MIPEEFLHTSIERGRVGHAYLFSGNDEARKELALTGFLGRLSCSPLDTVRVTPEGREIKVAQIRSLIRALQLAPYESPRKAAVIEEAHAMTQEAQSAFLKLLEEPPGRTVLFLKSAYPHALLATMRSRMLELPFYLFGKKEGSSADTGIFDNLRRASLTERFRYARNRGEDREEADRLLKEWLAYARQGMFQELGRAPYWTRVLRQLQEARQALLDTTVSPVSALERVLLTL